jgi:hypothetical protein
LGAVSDRDSRRPGAALAGGALVLLLGLGTVAGCAQAQDTAGGAVKDEPAIGVVETITDPSQVSRPLDAYRPSASQVVALAQAQARLTTQCYAQHGSPAIFTNGGDLIEFIGDPVRSDAEWSSLWGFFSPAERAHGYHRDLAPLESGPSVPVPEAVTGACEDQATGQMPFGQDWSAFMHPPRPDGLTPVTPRNDSRVVAVVEKWAQCMASAGFTVRDPAQSMTDSAAASGGNAEVTRAATDLRCKQETNLVGVETAVLAAYDQQFIEANRAALERYRATISDFLKTR